jgi:hypothetical protein
MGDYGIKITKAGSSVTSSTPGDYHFWSKYRGRSVKVYGSVSLTTSGEHHPSMTTNHYTHNFGYIPQFMAFTTSYGSSRYINADYNDGGPYGKGGELWEETIKAWATTSRLYIGVLLRHGYPQMGDSYGISRIYDFDILLFMEEVETS